VRLGYEKVAGLDVIDTGALVSWLLDVLSQTYTRLQCYRKSCLDVMTIASPSENRGSGMT
jgi:hypothetical protein